MNTIVVLVERPRKSKRIVERIARGLEATTLCADVFCVPKEKAKAMAMVVERLGGSMLILDKSEGSGLGLVIGVVKDFSRFIRYTLVQALKYGAMYIPTPTRRGCAAVLFPSHNDAVRFVERERAAVQILELKVVGSYTPLRLRDQSEVARLIRVLPRLAEFRAIMRKAFVDLEYLESRWSSFLSSHE